MNTSAANAQQTQAVSRNAALILALLSALILSTLPATALAETEPSFLERYSFATPTSRARLPKYLREISGLAAAKDQTVLLHHDNNALIWQFDLEHNRLHIRPLQAVPVKGDFEGIARVGGKLLLSSSHATLRVVDNAQINSQWIELPFSGLCNFEGLAVIGQPSTDVTVLLPCKYPHFAKASKSPADDKHIYLFRHTLKPTLMESSTALTRLAIDVSAVLKEYGLPRLRPSAIEFVNGTEQGFYEDRLLILAGKERLILETDTQGRLIDWRRLRWPRHRQAEGLTITPTGTLVIADEGRWLGGTVTAYTAH